MGNKDYKISVMVNRERYLKLRASLLLSGQSFTSWMNEAISDSLARSSKRFAQRPERDAVPRVK